MGLYFMNYDSLRSMAGEVGKIVDHICDIMSNSSSSDYDSDDEMSSRNSVVGPYSSCSTNETTRSETVECSLNPTKSAKRKKRKALLSSCSTDPKSVTPTQRCLEFRDEPFTVSAGKLFCNCCREELSLKRSIIKNHVTSLKHKNSKVARAKKQINDKTIVESLKSYEDDVHPRGENLPEA